MANIIVTVLEKIKIKSPFKNEKAGYFLMHDKDSGEVSAVPVDSILSKINDRVDRIVYPDGFTKTTPINRVGNKITIAAYDFAWRIQLNPYTNNVDFEETLDPTASPELKRIDSLAATTEGTIVYYKGKEDEFFIQAPDIPADQLRLTDLTVFGNEVQEQTEPFVGEVFTLAEKEKLAALNINSFDSKEDKSNKTSTITGNENSITLYATIKGIVDYFTGSRIRSILGITTLSGSNTGDQDLSALQVKDNHIEVSLNGNVLNSWHGQTVLFTASCTITVPATLNNSLDFVFRTLSGVTVTWAITSPFVWETTPVPTTEKTVGHFMRFGSTNTIILDV